ncbi:MAG: DUF1254 domain-containing protein [Terriglobales bacterium]
MSNLSEISRRRFLWLAGVTAAGITAIPFAQCANASGSDETPAIAQDAYIWGFPLVLMQWYGELGRQKNIPINRFIGKQRLSTPADKVVGPNIDTLYGYAWLDLAKEPQLLHVPDTNDRYYSIQLLDAYANTFTYVGRRVTGTKEGTYAIVGPKWQGKLPAGVQRIDAPTNLVLAVTRTLVSGDADLPAAQSIQRQYALAPLSAYPRIHPPEELPDGSLSLFQIPQFGTLGLKFFDDLAAGLATAPPPADDVAAVRRFAKVGVEPAGHPSQLQDQAILSALRDAVPAADARIKKADYSTQLNGWTVNYKVTNFIKDPLLRASVNRYGPATHVAQEALYFSAKPEGQPLSGANKYILRFNAGGLPPVDAFWSLTLYGADFSLVENPINRYSIGDRTAGLVYGSDGSLEVQIQNQAPVQGNSNWLPAPEGGYQLVLRTYQPKPALFNGSYKLPPLRQV